MYCFLYLKRFNKYFFISEGTIEFSHVNRDNNSPEAFGQCSTQTSSSEECDRPV